MILKLYLTFGIWFTFVFVTDILASLQSNKHCNNYLKKIPERFKSLPMQYADTTNNPIKILVSDELVHQIESRILIKLLVVYLNYQNVQLIPYKEEDLSEDANSQLWFIDKQEREKESFIVNLETHIPSLFLLQYDHSKEKGLINDTPGLVSWYGLFISNEMVPKNITSKLRSLNWEIFNKSSICFNDFAVNQVSNCETLWKSSDCSLKCPLIVTHYKYKYYNQELKNLMISKNLSAQIVVFSNNQFHHFLDDSHSFPFFIFSWSRSELINGGIDYHRISMPLCNQIDPSKGCLFQEVSRVKTISKTMEKLDYERLGRLLTRINFDSSEETDWIQNFSNDTNLINYEDKLESLVCSWLENNEDKINKWISHEATDKIGLKVFVFIVENDPYIKSTIDLTLAEITKSKILKYTYLDVAVNTDGCGQSKRSIGEALKLTQEFQKANADVILGPWCSESLKAVEETAINLNLPIINYAAGGLDLSTRNPNSTLFSVYGDTSEYGEICVRLMKEFGWKKLAAISVKGDTDTNYITNIQANNSSVHIFNREITDDEFVIRTALDEIKQNYRVIWIDVCKSSIYAKVMYEACKKNMMLKNGYIWITPLSFSNIKLEIINEKYPNCCANVTKLVSGTIFLQKSLSVEKNIITEGNLTVGEWWNSLEQMSNFLKNTHKEYTTDNVLSLDRVGYLRDSFWIFAKIVADLEDQAPEVLSVFDFKHKRTEAILATLHQFSPYHGITGVIDFKNNNGSRKSNFEILQADLEGNLTKLGEYKAQNGILSLNKSAFIWIFDADPIDRPLCFVAGFKVECENRNFIIVVLFSVTILITSIAILGYFNLKSYLWYKNTLEKIHPSILKMLKETQIPYKNLILNDEKILGQGEFGQVVRGTMKNKDAKGQDTILPVAVKYLKNNSDFMELRDFLLEAETLISLNHPNIIKLLGICIDERQICIILEFMEHGDLRTYLLKRAHLAFHPDKQSIGKQLTSYAIDIARALLYLETEKKLHRDIACRNVLINSDNTAKLADFGFSRDLCDNGYYRFQRKGKLPLRWCSPEVVSQGRYTTASDIWSYGILIYEIITFGANPYFQYYDEILREKIVSGSTIELPLDTPFLLKKFLHQCWDFEPSKRPKPIDILNFFTTNPCILVPCLLLDYKRVAPAMQRQLSADSGYVPPSEIGRGSTSMHYAAVQFLTHPSRQTTYEADSDSFDYTYETALINDDTLTKIQENRYLPMERVNTIISENEEYLNL